MKDRVKRLINFRMDRYKELETKLEKMAANGLVLESCGSSVWTFRRCESVKLAYTVTYFPEGSLFNPDLTDNQQTYIEYARAAGWEFVAQLNQMQIFCSAAENPVPFETDEAEKLANIKKCMKKSFIPSIITMIVVFSLNLGMVFSSFLRDPIDMLSNGIQLGSAAVLVAVVLYYIYLLADYFIWCRRSAKSIANGGGCIENTSNWRRVVDILFLCCIFGLLGGFILTLAVGSNWFILIAGCLQMPILMLAYSFAIKYMKKKKLSATENRVLSAAVLIVVVVVYMALMLWLIIGVGLGVRSDYRTVNWELSPTESHEYKLYSDPIPLTCEDLYGQLGYDYYSTEAEVDSTIFLTRGSYSQDYLPAKDAPPRLQYEIIEPRAKFIYNLAREQLLEIPEWQDTMTLEPIDNKLFGSVEAYQKHRNGNPTGQYVLLFEDKLVTLWMEEPPTPTQITIIRVKLELGM